MKNCFVFVITLLDNLIEAFILQDDNAGRFNRWSYRAK
jgi:hypothetical protein